MRAYERSLSQRVLLRKEIAIILSLFDILVFNFERQISIIKILIFKIRPVHSYVIDNLFGKYKLDLFIKISNLEFIRDILQV